MHAQCVQPLIHKFTVFELVQGPHRLFVPSGPGPVGVAKALGFSGADAASGGFKDIATVEMAKPSPIRTVIAADFDNDGFEELFFNNIGTSNRLFRQVCFSFRFPLQ